MLGTSSTDIIQFIGIMLTFLVAFVSLIFNLFNQVTDRYVNKIVNSRLEWIDKIRGVLGELSQLLILSEITFKLVDAKYYMRTLELNNRLHLLMSHNSEIEKELLDSLEMCLSNMELYIKHGINDEVARQYEDKSKEYVQVFMRYAEMYLKYEWNRAKIESSGKKYTSKRDKENLNLVKYNFGRDT